MGEVVPQISIDDLVYRAHHQWETGEKEWEAAKKKAAGNRIAVGKTLLELKTRIEAGEVGQVRWWDWYGTRFARSRRDAERVMELASAPDPVAAHEVEKMADRERVRASRAAAAENVRQKVPNSPTKSNGDFGGQNSARPKLQVVDPAPEPERPALREELIEQALDLVRQMTTAERLAFVTKLKKVYRE